MSKDSCDGCGRTVTVSGGIANIWSFGTDAGTVGTAITLELDDGGSYLLCYPCLEALPDYPTDEDIDRLEQVDGETSRVGSR
ncbi:hypothetical protein A6E15_15600 [Natrinema saccharevitans]|uniref:Small CPxCG-related zinc finger protein n=1 Tax=Natrinema saccharevitans TaxID=301967 RepID=A0A1S8B063_9EURY|nr:hypothetical protein [Natrinema saccharevitans]OLZ42302.1 hypothetical protein A6E15_15600 [Natrinema saccharevitans]